MLKCCFVAYLYTYGVQGYQSLEKDYFENIYYLPYRSRRMLLKASQISTRYIIPFISTLRFYTQSLMLLKATLFEKNIVFPTTT